ncbi:MAG: HupE/UreJ family protein [Bacteroidota bacterium]
MQLKLLFHRRCLMFFLTLVFCLSGSIYSFAHTINYALEKAPANEVIGYYLALGFKHIIPEGFDHILFVVGLCLLSNKLKVILWQATAFTVAHSITLAMSMKNIIVAPSAIVEPIIALSILFVAIENILLSELKPWRIILVFLFGLVHGLGFASSLNEIGLPRNSFLTSILSFNAGVELGQIAVILAVFLLLILPFKNKLFYRKFIVYPLSLLIGITAFYWTIERIFYN